MLLLALGGPLLGQEGLGQAAARARAAWLAHDPVALLQGSPGVMLQIPGADPSSAIGRDQASELLARYLRTSEEREVEVRVAREMEEGRGYVELSRRFIVSGTAEERRETVFLGLRRRGEQWVVVELRTAR
jgi:CRP-like cAMP-binding protein